MVAHRAVTGVAYGCQVPVSRSTLRQMVATVRAWESLGSLAAYRGLCQQDTPAVAAMDPGYAAAMMGYDFHLAPQGPQLIEVNTNAGGGYLAWLAGFSQPPPAEAQPRPAVLQPWLAQVRQVFSAYTRGQRLWPDYMVIMDAAPGQQYLYPEMQAFTRWLRQWGIATEIVAPEELSGGREGIWHGSRRVDLIYNRHCDFYLQSPKLAPVAAAYQAGTVCLSPHPYAYGLLAAKQRLAQWSQVAQGKQADRLTAHVPASFLGGAWCHDLDRLWQQRKQLVFKPLSGYGSRGVLLGRSISRKRFNDLPWEQTLVQQLVPPPHIEWEGDSFKYDLRLFTCAGRCLGLCARLYQGQVTNLRTRGGGFAQVRLR